MLFWIESSCHFSFLHHTEPPAPATHSSTATPATQRMNQRHWTAAVNTPHRVADWRTKLSTPLSWLTPTGLQCCDFRDWKKTLNNKKREIYSLPVVSQAKRSLDSWLCYWDWRNGMIGLRGEQAGVKIKMIKKKRCSQTSHLQVQTYTGRNWSCIIVIKSFNNWFYILLYSC